MKNINHLSMEEIMSIQKQIDERENTLKEERIHRQQEIAKKHIEAFRQNRSFILPLIEHDRTSCSDNDVCNGYGTADYGARCNKCHLIEILNGEWGNRFDITLSVNITDTEI